MQKVGVSHLAIGRVLCAFSFHSYLRDFDLVLPIGREIWKKVNVINIDMTSCIYIYITKKQIKKEITIIHIHIVIKIIYIYNS